MKTLFQALIILLLAIPFVYMIYDILRELINKIRKHILDKLKPVYIDTRSQQRQRYNR